MIHRKCIFFSAILLFLIFVSHISCQSSAQTSNISQLSNGILDRFTDAVITRDVEVLWDFRNHSDPFVRSNTWRAMAIAEFNDVDLMINHAIQSDDPGSWFALRFQELLPDQLDNLSLRFYNDQIPKNAACDLFYHHGDERTLEMLLTDPVTIFDVPECSGAVGGIMSRVNVPLKSINQVTELIVKSELDQTAEHLLYGLWRSPINRPHPESANAQKLLNMLKGRTGVVSGYTDEYLIRLTGAAGASIALERVLIDVEYLAKTVRLDSESTINRELNEPEDISTSVQLEVETARAMRTLSPEIVQADVLLLLNRPNPHIGLMALESLQQISGLDEEWLIGLTDQMIHFPEHPETALAILELFHLNHISVADHYDLLKRIDTENPTLKNRVLALYQTVLDRADLLEILRAGLEEEGVEALHSTNMLADWIQNEGVTADLRVFTREVMIKALEQQNRSVISVIEPILANSELFDRRDKEVIMNAYTRATENADRSTAQVLLSSLETLGLADQLADIELPEKPMRNPDWNRLSEMGENPEWILETNRGRIVIQLTPLSAPFTVSSIDFLTREGFYDGVMFHRVVRNFVIQGGDFDRKDGFGGPDFRIPTEPAYRTFHRGSVGMASSGPDTEGSQFFITHTRTPHLDGLYTNFGQVIEGMDVVDRIEMGDVVLKAEVFGSEK